MLTLTAVRLLHLTSEYARDGSLCHCVTSLANRRTDTSTLCSGSHDPQLPVVTLLSLNLNWPGPNISELKLTTISLYQDDCLLVLLLPSTLVSDWKGHQIYSSL